MKANELMIGDWVSYYKPGAELVIGRIKKLNVNKYLDGDDEIEVVDSKGCWMTIPDINELQPIPLTAEILEKNGFVENGIIFNYYYLAIGDFEVQIYFSKNNTQLIITKRYGTRILNILNIAYLHQLQHALRLCGIDKRIKL